jgi:hypothetical protein
MTKKQQIRKDLILTEDTVIDHSIIVKNIICKNKRWNLRVNGNIDALDINAGNINAGDINAVNINAGDINALDIDAWNINAVNINAWDINAGDINAGNINAGDINAWDIDAVNIICEKRIKKSESAKTKARIFIQNKSSLERKEW